MISPWVLAIVGDLYEGRVCDFLGLLRVEEVEGEKEPISMRESFRMRV